MVSAGATSSRTPLAQVTRSLTTVFMGREPADLVVTNGRLVNVHAREVEDGVDPRHCLLETDDVHPETIVTEGHPNRAVRTAVECCTDPLVAVIRALRLTNGGLVDRVEFALVPPVVA